MLAFPSANLTADASILDVGEKFASLLMDIFVFCNDLYGATVSR